MDYQSIGNGRLTQFQLERIDDLCQMYDAYIVKQFNDGAVRVNCGEHGEAIVSIKGSVRWIA